jgi:hypothetical protein
MGECEECYFWYVLPCGPVDQRRFGGTYCLSLQCRKIKEDRAVLLGVLFDAKDRGSTLLRNVEESLPDYRPEAPFLIQVHFGLNTLLPFRAQLVIKFYSLSKRFLYVQVKNCHSPRSASAANVVCRNVDALATKIVSLGHFLQRP